MTNKFKCEMCNFQTDNEEILMEHLFYEGEYDND